MARNKWGWRRIFFELQFFKSARHIEYVAKAGGGDEAGFGAVTRQGGGDGRAVYDSVDLSQ